MDLIKQRCKACCSHQVVLKLTSCSAIWTVMSAVSPDSRLGGGVSIALVSLCSASFRQSVMPCSSDRYARDTDSSFSATEAKKKRKKTMTLWKFVLIVFCVIIRKVVSISLISPVSMLSSRSWQCCCVCWTSSSSSCLSPGVNTVLSLLSAKKSAKWESRLPRACCRSAGDWQRTWCGGRCTVSMI